jgi:PHD/YefM family antitoxin component YafN of YafNO toxin-antitoxin module
MEKLALLGKLRILGRWGIIIPFLDQETPMTTSSKTATFLPLAKLPRTPASDLKKLGWRGMMNALRSKGKLLVTNHDEPEAVIILVEEYDALMLIVEQSVAQAESALAGLRKSFDERLAVLQDRSAAARLQSTIRARAKLGGKVKAGSGY